MDEAAGTWPDLVDANVVRGLREALESGDESQAWRLFSNLSARVANPVLTPELTEEMFRVTLLFHAIRDTEVAEDQEQFEAYVEEVRRMYSPMAVGLYLLGVIMLEGLEKGGLPAAQYNGLRNVLAGYGLLSDAQAILRRIERRD